MNDPDTPTSPTSPFSRRYQVFVSSTYEDLKEERRHVIQALLETKCIPAGMELFPAASQAQWDLIKRVIDESDYYIVIVAGRYGSKGPSGLSYTEMEFDYAFEKGKPVIGFFHENIDDLLGSKLEKTDKARKALSRFTAKVKSKHVCRSWRTAEALGSAIKSAIFHEIEDNPQPGWVRASSQADPSLLLKLKQRIADLEANIAEVSAKSNKHLSPEEDEVVTVEIEIEFYPKAMESKPSWNRKTEIKCISVEVPWPSLFEPLGLKLIKPRSKGDITGMLKQATLDSTGLNVGSVIPDNHVLKGVRLTKPFSGFILDRLIADGLIQQGESKSGSGYTTRITNKYKLTPKGKTLAAKLRAKSRM